MADKGQSKQQPKDNNYTSYRPRIVKALMPKKKKKPSSDSQSTPPPPGTTTAIAWTDETELGSNVDNTPPSGEITTDSERRMSDHSQRRNTSERNNPIPDGASVTTSLSEKDKEAARTAEQLMEREDEVTELKKQLQLKTMEATTLEERKYQLEQELTHMVDGTAVMAERAEIEKDEEAARIAEQLREREDEVTEWKKQLQLKTMEATTLEERKYQLEQELTHMVDGTAVMAERAEIEKEKQDMEAERRHYKRMEAQNVTLQAEIEQLKQRCLHHTIVKQGGGDSVTNLKQQLEEKEMKIRQLSQQSAEKTTICDEKYIALEETTQKFEKACKERDDNIAELKNQIEQWKEAGKNTTVTRAMNAMKIEPERILEEDKKKLLELQQRSKEQEMIIEELNASCIRLNVELIEANEESKESQLKLSKELQELKQERDHLGRKMNKIIETTHETSRELNNKQRLNNQKDEEIKQLKEDLSIAQSQIVIFKEELTKTLKEQQRAKEVINQLLSELEKDKQILKKSGKKSFDEMRRSLDEMKQTLEEERAATQQERTATEQQVRAYKRQIDGLNEQLTEIKEKNEKLQDSLNTKSGLETEISDLQSKIHSLKENENKLNSLLHDKVMNESELVNELDKMNKGNKVLKEKNNTISRELENTEEACRILLRKLVTEQDNHRNTHAAMENMRIAMSRDMENMRNANMDGARSATSSLSEKDKEAARTAEQLMEREDEVTELKKQLQLKTMEATTLEERKYQLEQELTHMVDGTAVMAERAEIEKEKQDMEAERRHYKRMEAQTVALQTEIERLKQMLLHHTVDKHGGDSVTDLKLQLEEEEMQIRQLSQRSADKTTMCDGKYIALEESTQKFEKACKERDDRINQLTVKLGELEDQNKRLEHEQIKSRTKEIALNKAMQMLKNEYQKREEEERQIKQLKEDQAVTQSQGVNAELTSRLIKERNIASDVINELETELEKNKQVLKKSGKKSFEEMRRSLDEMKQTLEEERAATQQERTATEQQVRAYKIHFDGLNEHLTEIKEKNEVLQNSKFGLEKEMMELESKIIQQKLALEQDDHRNTHMTMSREMENMKKAMSRDIDNLRNVNMILQQRLKDAWVQVDKLQDEILSLKLTDIHTPTESSNNNIPPVHLAVQRHGQLAGDIKENPILQNNDKEIEHVADNIRRQTLPPQTQEFLNDDNDDPSLGPYDPNLVCNGCAMRYRYGELWKLRCHVNEFCVARQYTQTIQPKHIIEYNDDDNIDKEIQQVAAEVRRVSQPPRTEEMLNDDNDDPSLGPYDPNLTCNGCGMRYRYGEIQKLRRHINEFCVSLKYTENQQPQDNDRV